MLIAEIEQRTGKQIYELFDLIGGTTPTDIGRVELGGVDVSTLTASGRARRGLGRRQPFVSCFLCFERYKYTRHYSITNISTGVPFLMADCSSVFHVGIRDSNE